MAQSNEAERLARALEKAETRFKPYAKRAMIRSLAILENIIAPYPPQPDRMRSGKMNTYVRGVGWYPLSAFKADTAEPGGFAVNKRKRGKVHKTSQQMDKKWRQYVVADENEIHGILRNEATYSGWVVGSKDQGETSHQLPVHTATGWPNKDDSITQAMPMIMDEVNGAVDDFLQAIGA